MVKKHFYMDVIEGICDHRHLTVDQIWEELHAEHPDAGRSTVYRNVEELVEQGRLIKLKGVGSKSLYEKTIEPHAHMVDQDGMVIDLPLETMDFVKIPEGYTIEDVDVVVKVKKVA